MSHVPVTIGAKEFEQILLDSAAREEKAGYLTMSRYGVQGVTIQDPSDPFKKRTKIVLVPSDPDFDGVVAGGRQFNVEAKVCSQSSFAMQKATIKPKQVEHMLRRSRFGARCFVVIHFNERIGQNFRHPAITVALPVSHKNPIWQRFVDAHAVAKKLKATAASQPGISRDLAQDMGQLVPWRVPPGCRKAMPDLLSFLAPDLCSRGETTATKELF